MMKEIVDRMGKLEKLEEAGRLGVAVEEVEGTAAAAAVEGPVSIKRGRARERQKFRRERGGRG